MVSAADPRSNAAKDLVRTVRGLPGPDGVRVYVGGQTAGLIDTTYAIGTRLPLAGLLIMLTTFIVLFLFTGSVVQPIRALVLNAVTLAATAGCQRILGRAAWYRTRTAAPATDPHRPDRSPRLTHPAPTALATKHGLDQRHAPEPHCSCPASDVMMMSLNEPQR